MRLFLSLILLALVGLQGAAQRALRLDAQTSDRLSAAQEDEKAQDYLAASRQYEEILKQHPDLALIRQSLAVTYHLQNRYLEAISEFRRAVKLDPTMWGSYLFLGMDYYKTNQFRIALEPLEKSITLNAKMAEPEARFWLAVTYSALDQPEDAVRELRRDIALRPGNIDVLYYLAKAYDQAAGSIFQRLGRIEPHAAAVSLLQAQRFLDENRRDLAGLQYAIAVRLRPDFEGWVPELAKENNGNRELPELTICESDARADLELAGLLAASGDYDRSLSVVRNLTNLKPENATITNLVAEARSHIETVQSKGASTSREHTGDVVKSVNLIREGRFRDAEQPLSSADAKSPSAFLRLLLLRSHVESGDDPQVEDQLRELLTAEPRNADALHLLGLNYERQAEATLHQMIGIDADSYGVHELLGKQHEDKTEYDLAIQEYKAALAKRPDLGGIRYAIGNVYRKMSRYDEAEKWLKDEISRNPYHGFAHYRLGTIYTEQGKPDAAIPHLLLALRYHPDLTDAQLDLGRAFTATGHYQDAIATLQRAATSAPDNDRVHYLLSVAYSKQGRREEAEKELETYQRLTRNRLKETQDEIRNLSNSLPQ